MSFAKWLDCVSRSCIADCALSTRCLESARRNADTLLRQAFTYDALGRVVGLSERVQGDTATYAYAYDAAGRLSEVRTGGVVTQAYTYDLNGNRTRVVTASQTVTAAYDAQDRLLNSGAATYTHAATGERTLKVVGTDTTRYRYDTFGNLRDVWLPTSQGGAHVQYEVDPQQRRTARLVNGVVTNRWLYQSQPAIAAEVDSAGTPVRTYVYGAHGNVPELMTTPSGQTFRFVTDQLGSVRLVMDALADTVVQRLDYDAYGRVVRDTKPGFQPFGYAGGVYEPLTGLVRFGARDYDAETGRWTAKDPAGFSGGSANLYGYAGDDPIDAGDPSGLWPQWIHSWLVQLALHDLLPQQDLDAVSAAGTAFDDGEDVRFPNSQDPENSYMHSMRAPWQGAIDATCSRDRFVIRMLNLARADLAAGNRSAALRNFGVGIHPLMDATSPYHTGPNGPLPWSGTRGEAASHFAAEATTMPTPEQYRNSAVMIRGAYGYVFGAPK